MHDAFGIPVPVELFCSCSLGAEGGGIGPLQYLLGIREQEANHVQESLHARDCESMNSQGIMMQQLQQISESDTSGSDSDQSAERSHMHQEMSVWVNIDSGELTMLGCSSGFAASILEEPLEDDQGFLDWLVRKQRQEFLVWLQTEALERTGAARMITLKPPLRDGNRPGFGKKRCTRRFICWACAFTEEPPDTPRAVRLNLHEQRRTARHVPTRRRPDIQPHDVFLWVEIPSKNILKSRNAPSLMFQEGSCLSGQEVDRLFSCISTSLAGVGPESGGENASPLMLGAYTLTSGGYQFHTEISLLSWGKRWRDTGGPWCRLSLSTARVSNAETRGVDRL
jgi:hypothetical protein